MISIICIGICILIIIFLCIKLQKKQEIDTHEYYEYKNKLDSTKKEAAVLEQQIAQAQKYYTDIINEYNEATQLNQEELDKYFSKQKQQRQEELDKYFKSLQAQAQAQFDIQKQNAEEKNKEYIDNMRIATEQLKETNKQILQETQKNTDFCKERYEALLAPLKQYEKDKLEKLFYTIQIPEEYRDDINFLLTTVNQKIQHPDVISKLVWTEYIRPYILETFKRVGIEPKPGIYKITNIETGKSYIGKSTDIKKRLADHFKSAVGIKSIADQTVHHAILKEGLWNWTIEYIIYCTTDQLNSLERYYIDFFKTQEFGYNRKEGG